MDEDDVDAQEYLLEEDFSLPSTPQERNVWDGQAVHLLIKEYKKCRILFGNPKIRRRTLWDKISKKLQALGYNFDTDQCEKKWRNLKNYYSINKGKNIVKWPFYLAMRGALHGEQRHLMKKVVVKEEGQHKLSLEEQMETRVEESNPDLDESEDDGTSPPAWFAKFLGQFREDEKVKLKMLEDMHEDIIKLEQKKCSLLKTLIEKMP